MPKNDKNPENGRQQRQKAGIDALINEIKYRDMVRAQCDRYFLLTGELENPYAERDFEHWYWRERSDELTRLSGFFGGTLPLRAAMRLGS